MAKKENGRELLRQDNDSLRKQFVECRKLLEAEREKSERLEKALDRIGFYCAGTDFNNISDFVIRVKNGEDI